MNHSGVFLPLSQILYFERKATVCCSDPLLDQYAVGTY